MKHLPSATRTCRVVLCALALMAVLWPASRAAAQGVTTGAVKMLQLSASRANGSHPYFTTPEHTEMARKEMGADSMLAPEQMVVVETDPTEARRIARAGKLEDVLARFLLNDVNHIVDGDLADQPPVAAEQRRAAELHRLAAGAVSLIGRQRGVAARLAQSRLETAGPRRPGTPDPRAAGDDRIRTGGGHLRPDLRQRQRHLRDVGRVEE